MNEKILQLPEVSEDDFAGGSLADILGGPLYDEFARANGFILLVSGAPGAGKTTLGLSILHDLPRSAQHNRPVFMLSLAERPRQILRIARLFGLSFKMTAGVPGLKLVMGKYREPAELNLDTMFRGMGALPQKGDLLLIDGLTADRTERDKVQILLDQLRARNLFAILVFEETQPYDARFLQHRVDGIIQLGVDSASGSHHIQFMKWRFHGFSPGKHSLRFKTYNSDDGSGGVKIYPSLNCLINKRTNSRPLSYLTAGISSGTQGMDQLIKADDGPFRCGDRILLIGPSGAGKSRLGMQFLSHQNPEEDGARVLLSFSRDCQLRAPFLDGEWHSLYYSAADICIDEVGSALYNLLTLLERKRNREAPIRLFVDHLSELRTQFATPQEYEKYLVLFLNLLKTFPSLVSMLSIDLSEMAGPLARVFIPAATHFTVVIGLTFHETHNRLDRGLVVLRADNRTHDSGLVLVSAKDGTLSVDPRGGFEQVGLLTGAPAPVHEERPFLKLFYQNASEEEVLEPVFRDFTKRYPTDHAFAMVCRQNPHADHWSFRNYAGAGHSNIKLLLLDKAVADAIQDNRALAPVPHDLIELFASRFDETLSFCGTSPPDRTTERAFMLPYSADVGVLVYQADVLSSLQRGNHPTVPKSWDEVLELCPRLTPPGSIPNKPIHNMFIIPHPGTDAKSFVAFFFELCWSFGWDYAKCYNGDVKKTLLSWVSGSEFSRALRLMVRLVDDSNGRIPNPIIGGHYHQAVFARRWLSKVHLRLVDAQRRAAAGHSAFQFGIAPMPSAVEGRPGYSCLSISVLGVLGGALAPETGWMLASSLLDSRVDLDRALKKRGLPIVRTMFEAAELKGQLRSPIPEPLEKSHYYEEQHELFGCYPETLDRILSWQDPLFKRTSDIPRYVRLQKALAQIISKRFDKHDKWSEGRVVDEAAKEITEIYD